MTPEREALEAYWMPYTSNRYFKDNPIMVSAAEVVICKPAKVNQYSTAYRVYGVVAWDMAAKKSPTR